MPLIAPLAKTLNSAHASLAMQPTAAANSSSTLIADAARSLRADHAHDALMPWGLLTWTEFVTSSSSAPTRVVRANERLISRSVERMPGAALAWLHRQRFYPAQWRKLAAPALQESIAHQQLSLKWIGWERSLPRMYLPVGLLTRMIQDAIQCIANSISRDARQRADLSLSVVWQVSTQQAWELIIEHPFCEIPPATMAALNAPRNEESHRTDNDPYQRIQRQLKTLGGWLTAHQRLGGGAGVRFSLPVDQPQTLVRSWLEHSAHSMSHEVSEDQLVAMHIIGRRSREGVEQLHAADARLQSLARPGDFVYRVGYGRWLWLTRHSQLPEFVAHDDWLSKQVGAWPIDSQTHGHVIQQVSEAVERLMAIHIPPLDCLMNRRIRSRADHIIRTEKAAAKHSPLNASLADSAQTPRWRYPI
ncbi:MAG: hypothetical protein IT423_24445 [Pirellulaceae bacterium]|nr:hypothetical protein [Pirellulaceae bacterium]